MVAIRILEYLDPEGRSPYAAWFEGLNAPAAVKIAAALYQLAAGNRSNLKAVGLGVFERKIDFGPGYRVYFGRDGESIVILRGAMALTRDFKDTVVARAQRDPRFRELLFTEAINAYLGGDTAAGKAILRDLVNATVGFEELAAELNKPSKSLHRMLAPRGNPSTENFFSIVSALQKKARVRLRVTAKAG